MKKKTFFLAGELSGDNLAAWFVRKRGYHGQAYELEGVGGDALAGAGVHLFARYETLNVTGLWAVLRRLPHLIKMYQKIVSHLRGQQFAELVLVDFPGFNLRMARTIKRLLPHTKIIYVSPPQLWCWGAWRIKKLRRYCDEVVVLYPFEVEWYAQRGVHASWLGLPLVEQVRRYDVCPAGKKNLIGLFPASRPHELRTLLPLFLEVAGWLLRQRNNLEYALFLTPNADTTYVHELLAGPFASISDRIILVQGEAMKKEYFSRCMLALTKPGTITLELAFMRIPAVVLYKTGWLTYVIARLLAHVQWMALPNLLGRQELMPEFIQDRAKPELVVAAVAQLLSEREADGAAWQKRLQKFSELASELGA